MTLKMRSSLSAGALTLPGLDFSGKVLTLPRLPVRWEEDILSFTIPQHLRLILDAFDASSWVRRTSTSTIQHSLQTPLGELTGLL